MEHTITGSEESVTLAACLPGPGHEEGTNTAATAAAVSAGELAALLTRVARTRLPASVTALVALLKVTGRLVNALTALQARVQVALLAARRQEAKDTGCPVRPVRGHVVQEIAAARRLSPYRAARSMQQALQLPVRLPRVWEEFVTGEIGAEQAVTVLKETRVLDPEATASVDKQVAPGLGHRSKRETEHLVRRAVIDADPDAAAARVHLAEGERHVTARPSGDGMISFFAHLPGMEGQAIWTGLEQRATSLRSGGDERCKEQIKADLLAEGLLSYLTYLDETDSSQGTHTHGKRPRPSVQIQLVMTDASLFGYSETTARADGLGPVPAPIAREWAREAIDDERASLIRLWTKPGTGKLVSMDSTSRTFPASLARYVRTRDHLCRTPWCGAPIRHIDHVTQHSKGGATSVSNAQGLCIQCNEHKDGPGWKYRTGADGEVTTVTPTGEEITTEPAELPHEGLPPAA